MRTLPPTPPLNLPFLRDPVTENVKRVIGDPHAFLSPEGLTSIMATLGFPIRR